MQISDRPAKKHFLIVDDEALVRETLLMLLGMDGHTVTEAASGRDGLALFQPGKFDLVFTDYCMPDMTGDRFAAGIKAAAPRQAIVMITAHLEKLRRIPLPWVDVLLSKPFDLNEIRIAIHQLCRSEKVCGV